MGTKKPSSNKLFNKQFSKGKVGEEYFEHVIAKDYFDELYMYNDFNNPVDRRYQIDGIDGYIKDNKWDNKYFIEIKSNLTYNPILKDFSACLEFNKWDISEQQHHGNDEEEGYIQDSKAHRIYHLEVINTKNTKSGFVGTGNWVYYDLPTMRNFIHREWNKPKATNWIRALSFVGGYNSNYARLISMSVKDSRFPLHNKRSITYR